MSESINYGENPFAKHSKANPFEEVFIAEDQPFAVSDTARRVAEEFYDSMAQYLSPMDRSEATFASGLTTARVATGLAFVGMAGFGALAFFYGQPLLAGLAATQGVRLVIGVKDIVKATRVRDALMEGRMTYAEFDRATNQRRRLFLLSTLTLVDAAICGALGYTGGTNWWYALSGVNVLTASAGIWAAARTEKPQVEYRPKHRAEVPVEAAEATA